MDTNEIIALSIVALAALLAFRCFFGKKGGAFCSKDCLLSDRPKDPKEKK